MVADLVDLLRSNVRGAQKLSKKILADPDTVILDTETTGLASGSYICDIAVIKRGETLFNTLVNPGVHIPQGASEIHGIYDEDVVDAPDFEEIWHGGLSEILRTKRVVIYNASYDLGVIRDEVVRLGEKIPFKVHAEDALRLYQDWYFGGVGRSGKGQTKLTTPHCDAPACVEAVTAHAKAGAHRAYADCLATVSRLQIMATTCWLEDHWREVRVRR